MTMAISPSIRTSSIRRSNDVYCALPCRKLSSTTARLGAMTLPGVLTMKSLFQIRSNAAKSCARTAARSCSSSDRIASTETSVVGAVELLQAETSMASNRTNRVNPCDMITSWGLDKGKRTIS
jgi:hypothetical protein